MAKEKDGTGRGQGVSAVADLLELLQALGSFERLAALAVALLASLLEWLLYLVLGLGLLQLLASQEAACQQLEARRRRLEQDADDVQQECSKLYDELQETDCGLIRAMRQRWRILSMQKGSEAPEPTEARTVQDLKRTAQVLMLCFQWSSARDPWPESAPGCKTPVRRHSSTGTSPQQAAMSIFETLLSEADRRESDSS
ncbi:unnamed protein product [Effrenium voratum]|nr:unnamed protein product [Effrenium voratum]